MNFCLLDWDWLASSIYISRAAVNYLPILLDLGVPGYGNSVFKIAVWTVLMLRWCNLLCWRPPDWIDDIYVLEGAFIIDQYAPWKIIWIVKVLVDLVVSARPICGLPGCINRYHTSIGCALLGTRRSFPRSNVSPWFSKLASLNLSFFMLSLAIPQLVLAIFVFYKYLPFWQCLDLDYLETGVIIRHGLECLIW